MKFGYAHISTKDQNLGAQFDDLVAAGRDKVVSKKWPNP